MHFVAVLKIPNARDTIAGSETCNQYALAKEQPASMDVRVYIITMPATEQCTDKHSELTLQLFG